MLRFVQKNFLKDKYFSKGVFDYSEFIGIGYDVFSKLEIRVGKINSVRTPFDSEFHRISIFDGKRNRMVNSMDKR